MDMSLKDATIKQCIDLALEKANTAVNYDTSNDFHNAIAAYTEAVELLVFVLQHPSSNNDTAGLKSICNIYLERIDFLSYLKMSEDSSNKKDIPQNDQKSSVPLVETSPLAIPSSASPSSHPQQHQTSKLNAMLMNIFAKKSTKKKKTSSATSSFSNHISIFNFTHHQKDAHKSIEIQPRSSKSTPMFPLDHSRWNKQARTKIHHLSSDNVLSHQYHGRSLSYTTTPLYLQQPVNSQQDNNKKSIPNRESRSSATIEHDSYPQKQFNVSDPFTIDKQYNTTPVAHSINRGSPAAETSVKVENSSPSPKSSLNTALPVPKKSSQRKKRASPPPFGNSEPIRDSSLNATSAWRSTNRSPVSLNSVNQCRIDIPPNSPPPPPPISDKSVNRTSTSLSNAPNKRISSLRLKTTFSLTNPPTIKSGGTISDPEDCNDGTVTLSPYSSIPGSPIKTIKIDPHIILSYPEAQVTVSNENIMNTFGSNMAEPTII
ncbi:uncharacterized protein ATC70_008627 [Mucor velutinosus]|uniref:MIT domain-containing protein n=1 Tax=Mucor velutinosus TaxID=708070 RepID=A0AAN7DLZ2_9FUNG|nr:hypothetical protein ATC70_008627 [Mucor velutinosus]